MAHDTPPVYMSNTRQLQGFLSLKKIERLRLCVEITENKASEKSKTLLSFGSEVEAEASVVESRDENYSGSYDGCSLEKEQEDNENDCSSNVEGEKHDVVGEDEIDDEDSPTLPPKKRYQNLSMSRSKGNLEMDYWKSHRTLKFAREIDEGTPECGFESLPSYLYMIRRANRCTVTRLQIDELGRFMYVFLVFGASVSGFPFMRKVVVVDGTFLNGKYKGRLLTALAQDDDSWHWFFTQLKLLIPDDEGLAIISDRHNSIGKAIRNVYPLAARGICTYHLYKNILGRYKGKEAFRLVKKAARCFRMSHFTPIFEEIEAIHPALHGYLQRADVRLWTRVHLPGERWFAERREDARSQPTTLTCGVEKLLHGRVTAARELTVQRIDDHHTEVKYGSSSESLNVVNLVERKCTCRRFEREKLPCVHVIAAAEYNNVCRISLCSPYYNSEYLVSAYAESIMPADEAEIVADQPCLPPYIRQQPGRPKKNRMKYALEVALQNKRPRKEHTCSRCRHSGHNAKTCQI
ncbi:uncharacterized protein LOC125584464 [Brassica napus]|uniref:uncharacterized protein LOC125584464 n=1 Tax=Brassica napus TaxID=3708 RepID=UPI002078826D|nr:uncharacterized protein LOC125584464 [Brassica napus]